MINIYQGKHLRQAVISIRVRDIWKWLWIIVITMHFKGFDLKIYYWNIGLIPFLEKLV